MAINSHITTISTKNSHINPDCQSVCPSVHLFAIPSIITCYNQVLLVTVLITYISAATYQKLFIFNIGVPGRVLFYSTSMEPWVMPGGGARGQNLGCLNKVVHCSLFIEETS